MIIWSGVGGILSGLLIVACLLVGQLSINGIMGDDRYYQTHGWPKLASFWLAAVATWSLGRQMNRPKERNLNSGKLVGVRSGGGHSLFFVPVQWLWVPLLMLGVVFALKSPAAGIAP